MREDEINILLDETAIGKRLDQALLAKLEEDEVAQSNIPSRARLQSLIKEGMLKVYPHQTPLTQASLKIKHPLHLSLILPEAETALPEPEDIPIEILYEDEALLVLNKPVGLVVHPGAGHNSGTLVNALLHHCRDSLSGIGGVARPGIVHRLDKETSGVMMVAKTDQAHVALSKQLQDRTASRVYHALVWNMPVPIAGEIHLPLGRHPKDRQKRAVVPSGVEGGREAITNYKMLDMYLGGAICKVECRLKTGRTHQIRVHMAHQKNWLLGDPLYGRHMPASRAALKAIDLDEKAREEVLSFPRQALHAKELSFIHPVSGDEMSFETELPQDMSGLLKLLQANT